MTAVAACTGAQPRPPAGGERGLATHADLADVDGFTPSYPAAELASALVAERGAVAARERAVAELAASDARDPAAVDQLRVAIADLAVQRRFLAMLDICEATRRWCPPRLDDPPWSYDADADDAKPPLDAPVRFDLDSWRKVTAEVHGRACACRTLACVDSIGVAIDRLEPRPMAAVRDDDVAAAALTRARECLYRLRGKSIARPPRAGEL